MEKKPLTLSGFKEKIFDFETQETWEFKGSRPAIIDFYADWCGPCKALSPVMDDLAVMYSDEVDIYIVDTEAEAELSSMFGIQSIPTLLFIPIQGQPMMQKGALSKTVLQQIINERLLNSTKKE